MSLRGKLIGFFCLLAAGPLIAVGVFSYGRSMRTLRELIASQTRAIAERAASELRDRYAKRESDFLLLAENAETQRMFRVRASAGRAEAEAAAATADAYLRRAWQLLGQSYDRLDFLDADGVSVYRLGEPGEHLEGARAGAAAGEPLLVHRPIQDTRDGHRMGTLVAAVRLSALLPQDAIEARFGRAGYTMVLDRGSGRVVYHPRHAFSQRDLAALAGPEGWNIDTALLSRGQGSFVYRESDSTRVASFASVVEPPWTVVSSGAVEEFAAPFTRAGLMNLALVLAVTSVAAGAFILLTRRGTRSLEALTAAADQVGTGNFAPDLPAAGRDEVGRLTAAFGLMVAKVRDMVREIETSRHMAAVGAFAARLAHEIRNPLTSLKLNLQSLERDAAAGHLPESSTRPVGICLREIERLDRVVGGALRLGRDRFDGNASCSVHQILNEALDVIRPQLEEQQVTLETAFHAPRDHVRGDPANLKAAFLNLFLNAVEAMPEGGALAVATDAAADAGARDILRIRVADTGPGVPALAREKIFEPFFSTKPSGTGFGLPVALRTVEECGGRLRLADDGGERGAVFLVELPLASEESPA